MTDGQTLEAGLALHRAGRFDEARDIYAACLAASPDDAEAQHLMGVLRLQTGEPADALVHFDRAVALDDGVAKYHGNRAAALGALGRRDEAAAAAQAAVLRAPDDPLHRENLATALAEAGRTAAAVGAWEDAIACDPGNASHHSSLANLLLAAGRLRDAVPHYRRAADLAPENPEYLSHLCVALNSSPDHSGPEILAEHRLWNDRHAAAFTVAAPACANDRDPDRRLRVGYVSPDWRRHPVGYLTLPALSHHDPVAVDVFLYWNAPRGDDMTELFRTLGHTWRDISGESDEAVAQRIRDDRIDVLVDLTGHHNRNRLLVFARRPAPVQMAWESYTFSTGLDAMDYYLGDAVQTPESMAGLYSEDILRFPESMACIGFPADAPAVGPSPFSVAGTVTFGVNASPASITPAVTALWDDILAGFPGSRIVPVGQSAAEVAALLAGCGIAAPRIAARPVADAMDRYAAWNEIDIALDPFPVSGNIETLEALWMGVPVVALAGGRRIARRTAGHLATLGLDELVAESPSDYVRVASALAGDTARLAGLRATLRDRVYDSALCDGEGFARALEGLYRTAWRRWCAA
ncbi:MAG: tetratricopeptide repeat protein [Rhodospirillaceae bacterium]